MIMNIVMIAIICAVLYSVYKRGLGIETMSGMRAHHHEDDDEEKEAMCSDGTCGCK